VIRRGDVIVAELSPVAGHEEGGRRPVLVLSPAPYNAWPIGMAIVAPITSANRRLRHHVPIGKESGLERDSYVMPEYVRAISQQRMAERPLGAAPQPTVEQVEWWVEIFTTDQS
jgi:mRNA interferase MazF